MSNNGNGSNLEKNLLEAEAGIVFPELNKYSLFRTKNHTGQPEALEFESGEGKPALFTEGIIYCAGIELRTRNSYGLLHAMGLNNTKLLLEAVADKHREIGVPLEEVQAFIKTDHMRKDYEKRVRDYFTSMNVSPEIRRPEIRQTGNFWKIFSRTVYSLRVA